MIATIQAIDEPESTVYVLRRPGHPPVMADWPQPLLEIAPDAVRLPPQGADIDWPKDFGRPVEQTWEPTTITEKLRERFHSIRQKHLRCEDCRKKIAPGDYVPLDLFRKTRGSSGEWVWDKTKERWAKRPRSGPGKRARRHGRRFRLVDLCSACAAIEQTKDRGKTKGMPRRGGRPSLLDEQQLRAAHKIYVATGLSMLEIARRLHATSEKGTLTGYQQSLMYGWRKLGLKLRDKGEQIAISKYGTDGTLSKHWKKRCKKRLRNGKRCAQYVRRVVTETGSHPAEDGLCHMHCMQAERKVA